MSTLSKHKSSNKENAARKSPDRVTTSSVFSRLSQGNLFPNKKTSLVATTKLKKDPSISNLKSKPRKTSAVKMLHYGSTTARLERPASSLMPAAPSAQVTLAMPLNDSFGKVASKFPPEAEPLLSTNADSEAPQPPKTIHVSIERPCEEVGL